MRILYHGPEQCFRLPSHNVAQEGRAGVGGGGGGGGRGKEGGGVTGTVHEPKKQRITDHGNENFIFPSHENKQEINAF